MRHRLDRLFLLTGGTQGLALAWGLPAVVWWVVELAPVTELFGVLLVWQVLWGIGWTLQSGAATAWMTDELALAARTHRIGALPPVPPGSELHASEPVAAEDSDSDDGQDQPAGAADRLIVHHAIWRSVGVMVGLVAAAAMGIWSVRGSPARRPAAGSLARHRRHRSSGPGRQPVVRRGTRRLDGSRRGRRDHLPVGRSHDQLRRPVCSARHGHLVPGSG